MCSLSAVHLLLPGDTIEKDMKMTFFIFYISIKGALRLPTSYDNHPIQSHPIPSTYSCEDDLSIEDLILST